MSNIDMKKTSDQLCDVVSLFADKAIKNAQYDKTIQGTVQECVDNLTGKYKISYQDSIFYAYANNRNFAYGKGAMVYILVPNGKMDERKVILGSVDELGTSYIQKEDTENVYNKVGPNWILKCDAITLDNTVNNIDIVPSEVAEQSRIQLIPFENEMSVYVKQASSIMVKANFKTTFSHNHINQGNYGFVIQVYIDKEKTLTRDLIFNVDDMEGNPYQFNAGSIQTKIFGDITESTFFGIKSFRFFSEGFSNDYSINISELQIYSSQVIPQTERDTCGINIVSPRGLIFSKPDFVLPITAEVKIKGEKIDTKDVPFYWFIEDSAVGFDNPNYCKYGGLGWKCINPKVQAGTPEQPYSEWSPLKDFYNFSLQNPHDEVTYPKDSLIVLQENGVSDRLTRINLKCAIVYENVLYQKEFFLQNNNPNTFNFFIESEEGFSFSGRRDNVTLHLKEKNPETDLTQFIYRWSRQKPLESREAVTGTSDTIVITDFASVFSYVDYYCSIFEKGENGTLGNLCGGCSARLINNAKMSTDNRDSVEIFLENGSQVFQYDEGGVSPTSSLNLTQVTIKPVIVKIFDPADGNMYTMKDIVNKGGSVSVTCPNEKESLIQDFSKNMDSNTLVFSIKDFFNPNLVNNSNLKVEVRYENKNAVAYTNFIFLKQGDTGTNGTDFVCNIVPNTEMPFQENPSLWVEKDNTANYQWNFTPKANEFPFKINAFYSGEQLKDSDFTVKWEMLEHYRKTGENNQISNFEVIDNNRLDFRTQKYSDEGVLEANIDFRTSANILKGTVTYTEPNGIERVICATLPLIITLAPKDTNINLKRDTGFKYVVYQDDGRRPKFTDSAFTIETNNQDKDLVYTWEVSGDDIKAGTPDGQNYIEVKPSPYYEGYNLNNKAICTIKKGETVIGTAYIPIHFMFNKYSLSHINKWEGNAIEISKEEGYILSPQVGAGIKNDDNTFTGVIMGEKVLGKESKGTGLYAFGHGVQTFNVDAETGKAEFGTGEGSIVINPKAKKDEPDTLLIESNGYSKDQKGIRMNFSKQNPSLEITQDVVQKDEAGQVILDKDGNPLTAKESLTATAEGINLTGSIKALTGYFGRSDYDKITIGSNKTVDEQGVEKTRACLYSGGKKSFASGEKGDTPGFYLGPDGFSVGTSVHEIPDPNFKPDPEFVPTPEEPEQKVPMIKVVDNNFEINSSGYMKANRGEIGGWHLGWGSISASSYYNNERHTVTLDSSGDMSCTVENPSEPGNGWYIRHDGTAYFKNISINGGKIKGLETFDNGTFNINKRAIDVTGRTSENVLQSTGAFGYTSEISKDVEINGNNEITGLSLFWKNTGGFLGVGSPGDKLLYKFTDKGLYSKVPIYAPNIGEGGGDFKNPIITWKQLYPTPAPPNISNDYYYVSMLCLTGEYESIQVRSIYQDEGIVEYINWGDGSVDTISYQYCPNNIVHFYSSSGPHWITVYSVSDYGKAIKTNTIHGLVLEQRTNYTRIYKYYSDRGYQNQVTQRTTMFIKDETVRDYTIGGDRAEIYFPKIPTDGIPENQLLPQLNLTIRDDVRQLIIKGTINAKILNINLEYSSLKEILIEDARYLTETPKITYSHSMGFLESVVILGLQRATKINPISTSIYTKKIQLLSDFTALNQDGLYVQMTNLTVPSSVISGKPNIDHAFIKTDRIFDFHPGVPCIETVIIEGPGVKEGTEPVPMSGYIPGLVYKQTPYSVGYVFEDRICKNVTFNFAKQPKRMYDPVDINTDISIFPPPQPEDFRSSYYMFISLDHFHRVQSKYNFSIENIRSITIDYNDIDAVGPGDRPITLNDINTIIEMLPYCPKDAWGTLRVNSFTTHGVPIETIKKHINQNLVNEKHWNLRVTAW